MPVCISREIKSFYNKTGYVTGWGWLNPLKLPSNFFFIVIYIISGSTGSNRLSTILMEASVQILFDNECEKILKKFPTPFDVKVHICAGHGGPDTCQGDSGKFTTNIFMTYQHLHYFKYNF